MRVLLLAAAYGCSSAERPIYQSNSGGTAGSGGTNPNSGGNTSSAGNTNTGGETASGGNTSGNAGTNGDGGMDGTAAQGGGAGAPDMGPDACGSQPTAGCIPDATDAIFVDPAAPSGGDGSLQAPLASISAALALVEDADASRVILCNAVYDEQVVLVTAHSGLSIQGGFSCADWTYDPQGEAIVRPSAAGHALNVAIVTGLTLMDVAFEAKAAVGAGASSVAGFITASSSIQLTRTRFVASDGQNGDNGETQAFVAGADWPSASSLNGDAASSSTTSSSSTYLGGDQTDVTCPGGGTTRGGRGGSHPPTQPGLSGLPAELGGDGGETTSTCDEVDNAACICVPVPGRNGGNAGPGQDGDGASVSGTLNASGWTPAPGLAGAIGPPGGGGGGGDGAYTAYTGVPPSSSWYGGGGGGAGGCGGNGGAPGMGGGASIALLVHQSTVFISDGEFVAGNAGSGGDGNAGQVGQSGGAAGTVTGSGTSSPCAGGTGGKGGTGGAGGGGAGGVSAGIVWSGTVPTYDGATTFTLGSGGEPGLGAAGDNDGLGGAAVNVLQAGS